VGPSDTIESSRKNTGQELQMKNTKESKRHMSQLSELIVCLGNSDLDLATVPPGEPIRGYASSPHADTKFWDHILRSVLLGPHICNINLCVFYNDHTTSAQQNIMKSRNPRAVPLIPFIIIYLLL
jgi:hypothetical protein